jgi:hypothetical protein
MRQEETTKSNEYIQQATIIIITTAHYPFVNIFYFMFFCCLTELDMKFSFAILAFSTRQDLVAGSSTVKKV